MVAGSLTPQASNNCTSCLRAASSFQARFLATSVSSSSSAPLRSPLAFSASARSKRACASFGSAASLARSVSMVAGRRRLARELERGARACHGCGLGLRRRDERQRLLGAGEIAGLDVALGESGKALRVLAILLQDLAEQLRRVVDVAGGERRLGGFEVRRDVARGVADQARDKGVDARLGQRSHEAVDRTAVLEGEHGGDRLHAHLAGDLRVVVDIELDQPDRALRRAHRLFQDRRELAAGPAPRRPEIDQHRHLARGLDHVAHEVLGGGVLDEVGSAPPAPPSLRIGVSTLMLLGSPALQDGPDQAVWQPAESLSSAERENAGRMAASLDEADEVLRRQPRGRGVHERMAVHLGEVHQRRIDHDDDPRRRRIDQRQRRDRTGWNTEHRFEQLALPKLNRPAQSRLASALRSTRVSSLATTSTMWPSLSVRNRLLVCAPGMLSRKRCRLLDREHRRVLDGGRGDAELVQPGKKRFAVRAHGVSVSSAGRWTFAR